MKTRPRLGSRRTKAACRRNQNAEGVFGEEKAKRREELKRGPDELISTDDPSVAPDVLQLKAGAMFTTNALKAGTCALTQGVPR